METALIIATGAGITAAALLLRKKKKKPVYTERNVVWWIDKHISLIRRGALSAGKFVFKRFTIIMLILSTAR